MAKYIELMSSTLIIYNFKLTIDQKQKHARKTSE